MNLAKIAPRARNVVCRSLLALVRSIAGRRPVPLDFIRAIRRLGSGSDPLIGTPHPVDGGLIRIAPLAARIKGQELGMWALGPRTLEAVVQSVIANRPGIIIEFGSGVSTVALAWAIQDFEGVGHPRLLSIEQDPIHAERTRTMLVDAGLQEEVAILVAPLASQTIEGVATTCYVIPPDIKQILGGRQIDMVVIDGPAAESGARFGTLPLIKGHLADGARFFLDDALRDGELDTAGRWSRLPYIRLDGVRAIEKGLLTGHFRLGRGGKSSPSRY